MKIAISSAGKNKENLLDRRFGRCEYFQIYDTENEEYRAVSNDGAISGQGAGIAAANQLIEENVDAIITGNLGPNAFELIEKAEIAAYSCEAVPVFKAVDLFSKKELMTIGSAGKPHHGMR